jgi:HlyD family secretion protein
MMKKIVAIGLVVSAVILSGCEMSAEETPTPEVESSYAPIVSITGEVVPDTWATVSAQSGGTVVEVLVEDGDEVAAGDLLARLDSVDAELAVAQAEAALETARAQLALLGAGPHPEQIAVAEAQIAAAQATISQTVAQRDQLTSGATAAEIAAAQAQIAAAQAEQLAAQKAHDQTLKCYDVPGGGEVCPGLGDPEEQARYNLHAANEALEAAQSQLYRLFAGADVNQIQAAEASIAAATAQWNVAQAQLDLLQAGPLEEEIAVSQAAVAQAGVALETARVALERAEIRAPFAGTVGMVNVRAGELIAPGQPMFTLGDLNTLQIKTTDLDELDVARVEIGQQATVVFDALSNRVFTGHVIHISPMAEPGAGGVHYTAIVVVDEIAPEIRWGMTAFVDIEVGE